jgi:phosphatidate cytidylyltransferase
MSGAALLLLAIAVVWFAPPLLFFFVAEGLLLLAFVEYVELSRAAGVTVPAVVAWAGAAFTAAAFSSTLFVAGPPPLDVVLLSALVALGAIALTRWDGGVGALALAAASAFPALYLGLPVGAMIAVREGRGREALGLLMLTVIVSDTAQYYTGRVFGRHPLAPSISPKKTIEGAVGGFLFGALLLAVMGRWWLPTLPATLAPLLGAAIVAAGIAGDLFESMLKRSARMKDSSTLIPGHGGVLDRIDALLFAAPVYYLVLKYM